MYQAMMRSDEDLNKIAIKFEWLKDGKYYSTPSFDHAKKQKSPLKYKAAPVKYGATADKKIDTLSNFFTGHKSEGLMSKELFDLIMADASGQIEGVDVDIEVLGQSKPAKFVFFKILNQIKGDKNNKKEHFEWASCAFTKEDVADLKIFVLDSGIIVEEKLAEKIKAKKFYGLDFSKVHVIK